MSVADGIYYLISRVMSPNGSKLALTSKGVNMAPVMTPLTNDPTQQWVLTTFTGDEKFVAPQASPNLQVGWSGGTSVVLPAGGYVWNFLNEPTGIKITDGQRTVVWGVAGATNNEPSPIASNAPREAQRWILVKA